MRKIACIPLVVLLFACGGTSETVEKTAEEAPTTTSEKPTTTIEVKNESTEFSAVCELEETSLTLFCLSRGLGDVYKRQPTHG